MQATVVSYILQNQPQRAVTFLEEQSSSHPTDAMIFHALGEVYRLQEKWDQATLNYEKALAKNPDAAGSAVALANLYVESGRTNDAIRLLVNSTKRKPQDIGLAVATAQVLEGAKQWQKAQKAYERVLELDSNNALALNNLAWVLTENGGNIDVALGLAQKAKERQPDSVNITNTIGWIYYKKNSYQTALQYLREAAEKQPQKALYQYHLGMAYLKNDRKQEARKTLERVLQLDPKFSAAEAVRRTLSEL